MSHSHSHPHSHDQIHSANKHFFDKLSSTYSHQASHRAVTDTVFSAILSSPTLIPLSESTTRVLDYACGSGMVSQPLLPHVASIVGMDLSPGMVEEYNAAANNQGLSKDEMHAVVADLCSPSSVPDGEEYRNFDVAICSFAFHHIPDPAEAARKIAERLKKEGGVFVLVDFKEHDDVGEDFRDLVAHNGFKEETVKEWFLGAGLGEPVFIEVGEGGKGVTIVARHPETGAEMEKVKREVFVAVGRRG